MNVISNAAGSSTTFSGSWTVREIEVGRDLRPDDPGAQRKVTIDKTGKSWFPRMFGQGGFAVIPDPHRLTMALPQIYRQPVGA